MIDTELVIYEFLNSASTLKTAIGNNLFTEVADNFNGDTSKGLRFRIKGGSKNAMGVPVFAEIVDFFCYGGSRNPESSKAIYRLLVDRLHGITNEETTSGFIIGAREVVNAQFYIEPDTQWRNVFATYEIIVRDKTNN